MNASMLLTLYPRAWRNRYEAEFRAMLEDHPVSAIEALDIVLGAVDAHLRPRARGDAGAAAPPSDPVAAARRREATHAVFFAHLALFVAVLSIAALVNVFFTPGNWWVLYPLWAWGTLLASHAAITFSKGLLGAHLVFSLGLGAGLVGINLAQGGGPWSVWPILALGILAGTHVLIALRRISLIQAHGIATALGAGLLALAAVVAGPGTAGEIALALAPLGVLLAAHWLIRARGWNLLQAHAFTYVTVLALLLAQNLLDDQEGFWVQYPFAMWTVLLAGHVLIHLRRKHWSGSSWEAFMLEELGARGETDRQRRLVSTLWVHVYLFLAASAGFVLLDLLGGEGRWAAWPIGVWYGLVAVHAGYVLAPRRVIGALLFGWLAAAAGLFAIDWFASANTWWYWPVMWSGVAVALIAGAIWTRGRPWVGMHVLGGAALALALVVTDLVTGAPAWWFYPVAAIIATWLVHFFLTMDLPRMLGASTHRERP